MGQFTVVTRGKDAIFQLSGALGLEETAALRPVFWETMQETEAERIIVDLKAVSRLDASMISLFVATKNGLTKRRRRLILCGMKREIFQVFEQTNLNAYFDIRKEMPAD
ncbi:STAS domain-containing protein [Acanthopleuribacter pedis]|uniref:STAS domain-containing protein n=1 Tax=Acanthopleuribacter pedis TaxID=442870 RepID=A0A8J7QGR3_9BACT|nr:STAS domain-containing protein [Acanthopleuribacter pedis]MBO1320066.1 STAS domain-containing protein [Acanthopleuribacter pedis]